MGSEATDFRYNTGATKVPWAAVGEDYNAQDLMEIVKFLMQGSGPEHDAALADVEVVEGHRALMGEYELIEELTGRTPGLLDPDSFKIRIDVRNGLVQLFAHVYNLSLERAILGYRILIWGLFIMSNYSNPLDARTVMYEHMYS